ncbi:DUF6155 family protein [Sporosarcina oncorhynchi]|uniref:DUF6155 family protein n=1 Tax=Sporosarcina oncorhynchi TaxID=3056444 RepID=A0ABZ0L4I4_9BACL|nr:DUF6155 family protein [Sporosarcina sp. T2O-4]WOV87504.1 DUF6155 family protein [Sporosarcina sp. T2O-4]
MAKLKVTDVKKYLKDLDEKELTAIIMELYKANKPVQDYFSIIIMGETAVQVLFEKAQVEIKNEFFPAKGHAKIRLSVAKKAISDFKKKTGDIVKTTDLMLYYVEIGTEFTNTYGDIDMAFYNSLLSVFEKVVEACEDDEQLYMEFTERLYDVVEESGGVGWGYHDGLSDLYYSLSWLEEE